MSLGCNLVSMRYYAYYMYIAVVCQNQPGEARSISCHVYSSMFSGAVKHAISCHVYSYVFSGAVKHAISIIVCIPVMRLKVIKNM